MVAPFAGAWIEIPYSLLNAAVDGVAPFAGAWIEIMIFKEYKKMEMSLPSRERGLK